MKYGSVCSGVEAVTVAWHPLGWKPSFFSEIDKFPRAVLAHHYRDVPCHGDFTTIKDGDYEPIDLLVGGTPCQSFSIAGLRKGLADDRGNLSLEFIRLAERLKPRWILWENVPGVLSIDGGKAFGSFLGGMGECGYGFAYRVLDAQYFGVPQRRRRVFVVGYSGDWRPAAAVLFERESLRGDITPRRETGKDVAGTVTRGFEDRGVDSDQIANGNYAISEATGGGRHQTAKTLITKTRLDAETETLIPCQGGSFDAASYGIDEECNGTTDVFGTLLKGGQGGTRQAVAYGIPGNWIGRKPENGGNAVEPMHDVATCLTKADQHGVAYGVGESSDLAHCLRSGASRADKHESTTYVAEPSMAVRRLTPVECERLQGFPDGYTDISTTTRTPDGPRYKAMGNSMAVPVMNWLGKRIAMVDDLITKTGEI